jgi:hypothetical protein
VIADSERKERLCTLVTEGRENWKEKTGNSAEKVTGEKETFS